MQYIIYLLMQSTAETSAKCPKLIEPILQDSEDKFIFDDPVDLEIDNAYKNLLGQFWVEDEIEMEVDVRNWDSLPTQHQQFIKEILAFFAAVDGLIADNLATNFFNEVGDYSAKCFYAYQTMNELIHGRTYAKMIKTLIQDRDERDKLFRKFTVKGSIKDKADWIKKYMDTDKYDFAKRIVCFAIIEGVFFCSAFSAIFWFGQQGNLLPGLLQSNAFIARDESAHANFACLLYNKLHNRLSEAEIYNLFEEAVKTEDAFIDDTLPIALIGMNAEKSKQYVRFVADRLLEQLGYAPRFRTANPFLWMENIGLDTKDNFFERRATEYTKARVNQDEQNNKFSTDVEF